MHWIIYVVIAICLILSIFFIRAFLRNIGRTKNTKLLEKSVEIKSQQSKEHIDDNIKAEEQIICPAIFNKDAILKEFKAKNNKSEDGESYDEFQERDFGKMKSNKIDIGKSIKKETVLDEVNNLSDTLKTILFTDVIKPKN